MSDGLFSYNNFNIDLNFCKKTVVVIFAAVGLNAISLCLVDCERWDVSVRCVSPDQHSDGGGEAPLSCRPKDPEEQGSALQAAGAEQGSLLQNADGGRGSPDG